VAVAVLAVAVFQQTVAAPLPGKPPIVIASWGGLEVLARTAGGTTVFRFMPVVPMVIGSALLMILGSLLSKTPSETTIKRYFD
jgi:hypothetical protein